MRALPHVLAIPGLAAVGPLRAWGTVGAITVLICPNRTAQQLLVRGRSRFKSGQPLGTPLGFAVSLCSYCCVTSDKLLCLSESVLSDCKMKIVIGLSGTFDENLQVRALGNVPGTEQVLCRCLF